MSMNIFNIELKWYIVGVAKMYWYLNRRRVRPGKRKPKNINARVVRIEKFQPSLSPFL